MFGLVSVLHHRKSFWFNTIYCRAPLRSASPEGLPSLKNSNNNNNIKNSNTYLDVRSISIQPHCSPPDLLENQNLASLFVFDPGISEILWNGPISSCALDNQSWHAEGRFEAWCFEVHHNSVDGDVHAIHYFFCESIFWSFHCWLLLSIKHKSIKGDW